MMAAKYKAYPRYKDSGVEWLGQVPKGWGLKRVGNLFKRVKRTGYTNKTLLSVYRDYGVIIKASRNDNNNKASEDLSPYQLVQSNDLVTNKMKAWQGSIAISIYEGIVSPAYFVYKPFQHITHIAVFKYLHYLLRSMIYTSQYLRWSKGIRVNQWDLNPDEFKRIEVIFPKKMEQKQIATYLDYTTAKIDTLIEKQKQLIKLLKEKRQAVISHAVTKGLDPNAPMKDSGVEWLAQVPKGWEVTKVKYEAPFEVGWTPSTSNPENYIGPNLWANISDLKSRITYETNKKISNNAVVNASMKIIPKGSLLYSFKLSVGAVSFAGKDLYTNEAIASFLTNSNVLLSFLFYSLPEFVIKNASTNIYGARILNQELIRNALLLIPESIETQKQIATYLDYTTAKIDNLIKKQKQCTKLLIEKRQSIISHAVTGKIDVRDWQAPAQKQSHDEVSTCAHQPIAKPLSQPFSAI